MMLFSTVGQGWVFVWMVAAGAAIGCWYALLAALRQLLAAGFWLSLAADLAFGAGAAAIFCAALVAADYWQDAAVLHRGGAGGLCAVRRGPVPPGPTGRNCTWQTLRHIFVKFGRDRWSKVIFR